jgi:hypothetical protein
LYRLERGSAYPEAADPAVVLLLLPAQARQTRMLQAHAASVHPQGRRFAYRLHLVDSGEFLSSFALLSFFIFSKPMLKETHWIHNGMLEARTAY